MTRTFSDATHAQTSKNQHPYRSKRSQGKKAVLPFFAYFFTIMSIVQFRILATRDLSTSAPLPHHNSTAKSWLDGSLS